MVELGFNPSEVELIVPKFVITDRIQSINYWAEQMELAKSKLKDNTKEVLKQIDNSFGSVWL